MNYNIGGGLREYVIREIIGEMNLPSICFGNPNLCEGVKIKFLSGKNDKPIFEECFSRKNLPRKVLD